MVPTESDLEDAIYRAAGAAFRKLFVDHADEHFYYFTLITTGAAHRPFVSAWSHEALASMPGTDEDRRMIEWSYADSPYCCFGDEHFEEVERLFGFRPAMDFDDQRQWSAEWEVRVRAMEIAMARLSADGLFGTGSARLKVVAAVEVMPPDHSNMGRVIRLNPPGAVERWLAEVAEPPDGVPR